MEQNSITPQKFSTIEDMQKVDPEFDLNQAYTFYGHFGGSLEMVFIEEIPGDEGVYVGYRFDGEVVFEKRAKFQIFFRKFGSNEKRKLETNSFYSTKEMAEKDLPNVFPRVFGIYKKIEKEKIVDFINRDVEDEE